MSDKRLLCLYIIKMLQKYTDDSHSLTYSEINNILQLEYGLTADVKTIASYIMALQNFGVDVMKKENNIEGCLENDITINDYCCCDLDVVSLYHACVKNDIEKAKSLNIEDCCECGICSYICRKDIRQTIREVKSKLINK